MTFPQRFEVVLCHEAKLPQPFFLTDHAGLLYPRSGGGYTYIEKAGGLGPFVRLDLDSKEGLLIWLAAAFRGIGQPESPRRFVTFSANELRPLVGQTTPGQASLDSANPLDGDSYCARGQSRYALGDVPGALAD